MTIVFAIVGTAPTAAGTIDELLDLLVGQETAAIEDLRGAGEERVLKPVLATGFEEACEALRDTAAYYGACPAVLDYERVNGEIGKLIDGFLARPDLDALEVQIGRLEEVEDLARRQEALTALYDDVSSDVAFLFDMVDQLDEIIHDRVLALQVFRVVNEGTQAASASLPDAYKKTLADLPVDQMGRDLLFWQEFRGEVVGVLDTLSELRLLINSERDYEELEERTERRVFKGKGVFGLSYFEDGERKCTVLPMVHTELVLLSDFTATLSLGDSPQSRGDAFLNESGGVTEVFECFTQGKPRIYSGTWSTTGPTTSSTIGFGNPEHRIIFHVEEDAQVIADGEQGATVWALTEIPQQDGARVYHFDFWLPEVP